MTAAARVREALDVEAVSFFSIPGTAGWTGFVTGGSFVKSRHGFCPVAEKFEAELNALLDDGLFDWRLTWA